MFAGLPIAALIQHVASARRTKQAARAVVTLCLCSFVLASCRQVPALQEIALVGESDLLASFQGRWYDHDWVLTAEIRSEPPATLALRAPSGFRVADARADGEGLHFLLQGHGEATELSLQPLDDMLFIVRRGERPSWCGSQASRLERFSTHGFLLRRIEKLKEGALATYEGTVDWLAMAL